MERMDKLFFEMDSLKNSFFYRQFQENKNTKDPKKE
jgi:hypothetical protein